VKPMLNPILAKEFRIQMRDQMSYSLSLIYVIIICGVVFSMFWFASTSKKPLSPEYGKDIFLIFFTIMTLVICTISAGLGARLISSERIGSNFDLLKSTLLNPYQIISGKILPLVIYIIILMLLSAPLALIIISMSGISHLEMIRCYLIVFISSLTFSIIGFMWSSIFHRTRTSTALTYITVGIFALGTIIVPLILTRVFMIKIPQTPLKIINSISPFISIFRGVTKSESVFATWETMIFGYLIISAIALSITFIRLKYVTQIIR
jgi:ABC-type transport system involved in multi-copper enzyme maturation permease subunit